MPETQLPTSRGQASRSVLVTKRPVLFWSAAGSGVLLAAVTAAERLVPLNWRGLYILDLTLSSLNSLAIAIFLASALILISVCVKAIVKRVSAGGGAIEPAVWIALAVQALAVAVYIAVPTRVGWEADSRAYRAVAAMFEDGRLPCGGTASQPTPLPRDYRRITLTGGALARRENGRLTIYFPVDRAMGVYERWVVYVSDDRSPRARESRQGSVGVGVRKLASRWYDVTVYQ